MASWIKPPIKPAPMPDVRVTQHALQDVKTALDRALNCTTVNQMTDALVSLDYFYNIARIHHIDVINNLTKETTGVYVPEQYVKLEQKQPKPPDDCITI